MTAEQLAALHASIPRLEARRLRRALRLRPDLRMNPNDMHDLILEETDSEDAAQEGARRYLVHCMHQDAAAIEAARRGRGDG